MRHAANTVERHYATQTQCFRSLPVDGAAGLKESSAAHPPRFCHSHGGIGSGSTHKPVLPLSRGNGVTLAKVAGIKFAPHRFESA